MTQAPATRKYEVTQLDWSFDASFARFTEAFESLLGRMSDLALGDLRQMSADAARAALTSVVGPLDFVLFQKLDHGAIVASLYGRAARAMTYVFGNALIAVEMTKHDLLAGLYVPLRLFVQETSPERVRVTYDLPSSLIMPLGSPDAAVVARNLDTKVERLLEATRQRPERRRHQPKLGTKPDRGGDFWRVETGSARGGTGTGLPLELRIPGDRPPRLPFRQYDNLLGADRNIRHRATFLRAGDTHRPAVFAHGHVGNWLPPVAFCPATH